MIAALFGVVLFAAVAALFIPILRGDENPAGWFRYTDDPERELRGRKEKVRESIRDLLMEKENGKLSAEEFETLAAPLAAELDALERETPPEKSRKTGKKFCQSCGHYNFEKLDYCIQCGREFKSSL